jgi:hypothetical protein
MKCGIETHYSCFSKLAEKHERKENKCNSWNVILFVRTGCPEIKLVSSYSISINGTILIIWFITQIIIFLTEIQDELPMILPFRQLL